MHNIHADVDIVRLHDDQNCRLFMINCSVRSFRAMDRKQTNQGGTRMVSHA